MTKGCYGYLHRQKKKEIIRTVLYFGLSAAIFAMGYLTTKTRANLLTIVAVLGCLPASKSMVSMIMYLRAGTCSESCRQAVRKAAGDVPVLYDLYLTSYRNNFQISAAVVRNQSVCGYTEDKNCDLSAGEKHITKLLQQSGYGGLTVKLFDDLSKFTDRLMQMRDIPEKTAEKEAAVAEVLKDISL